MAKTCVESVISQILSERKTEIARGKSSDNRLEEIRNDIVLGKQSTGDEVMDFLIAWADDYEGKHRELVQRIQEKVNSALGNPLLVSSVMDTQEPDRYIDGAGQDRPVSTHLERHYHLRLGVVQGQIEIDVRKGKLTIPAQRYAERRSIDASFLRVDDDWKKEDKPHLSLDERERKWKLSDGNIILDPSNLIPHAMPTDFEPTALLALGETNGVPNHRTHFYAGKEIDEFFTYPTRFRREEEVDLSYVDALNMLGLSVPEKFQTAKNQFLYETRIKIYTNLDVLVVQETSAAKEVQETEERAKELRGRRDDDLSRDDCNVLSRYHAGVNGVNGARKKIAENLQRAIELGVHQSPRVMDLVPGKTIDFPKYISHVLKAYPLETSK